MTAIKGNSSSQDSVDGERQASDRLPWLPLWIRDWLGSPKMARLTVEQEGVHLRLLLHAWEEGGCKLSADSTLLANLAKIGADRWPTVGERVLELLWRRDGDSLIPLEPDLPELAERAQALREQKRGAGRKSAEARRERDGTAQPQKGNPRTSVRADSNTRSAACSTLPERAGAGDGAGAGFQGRDKREGNGEAVEEGEQEFQESDATPRVRAHEEAERLLARSRVIDGLVAACAKSALSPAAFLETYGATLTERQREGFAFRVAHARAELVQEGR